MDSTCVVSSGVGIQRGLDPGEELVHVDVHAGVIGLSAALSPGHQASEHSLTHQWASRVPLQGGERQQAGGREVNMDWVYKTGRRPLMAVLYLGHHQFILLS